MTPPRFFDWLLRRVVPPGPAGETMRGDLLEELSASTDAPAARRRFRVHVLSIAVRYALRPTPTTNEEPPRKDVMDTIRQQLKFAVRSLLNRPSYAVIVVATLALGIGANTAIFSILHALVLRTLPVADPARLFIVSRTNTSVQHPLFRHFQANSQTVDVLAFRTSIWRFTAGEKTDRITGALVSGSYFSVLGVNAALGTTITNEDDSIQGSGGPRGPVAVLSHGFWMRQFGGSASVIGAPIILNARPFTVVGVTPPGFAGTEIGESPDVFAPMMLQRTLMPGVGDALNEPRSNWLRIIARLKPGVEVAQAEAELTSLLRPYNEDILRDPAIVKFGANYPRNLREQRITLLSGSGGLSSLRSRYSQPLFVVMAVMALVLLIACANIANLSLSRAAARQRDVAIRLGLGATRSRLVGQLLTESLLLAAAGGISGLLFARWVRDVLLTYLPVGQTVSAPLDQTVLMFTFVLAVGAAVFFGLAPAYQSTKVDVAPVLKGGLVRESSRSPFRKGLVVFQVSLSLVVVIGAVLFLRSLTALLAIDTGFKRDHVLVASVDVVSDRNANFYARFLESVRTTPGVESAALSWSAPLGTNTGWLIFIQGYVPKANEPRSTPWVDGISPGYFKTMGIPILRGRDFADADATSGARTMIVNETFARHYFGDEDAVGKYIGLAPGVFDIEIVGVVKDGKYTGLREEPVRMMYVPHVERANVSSQMTVMVRTAGDPLAFAPTLRQRAVEIDRQALVYNIATAQDQVDRSLLRERLIATVSGLFGALALLLAAIGLYGVLSYGIAYRTREFGIRIAIGAEAGSILRLVMREAGWVLAFGIAFGLAAAWWLGQIVRNLLYGIEPSDLVSIALAVGVLTIAGAVAAWIPARRASRIDPILALRYE